VRARSAFSAWLPFGLLLALFLFLTFSTAAWKWGLGLVFHDASQLLYPRADPSWLVGEHLALVGISSVLAIAMGIGAGVAVTRPWGRQFLPVAEKLAAIAQTFPPAAVLALAVPAMGFGISPTIVALFLYSILPILRNTMEGIAAVPADVAEAARGMGMKPAQVLGRIEIPLAAPLIIAGVRTSVIVNVGTATIGATIGAGGLGAPIISGLVNQSPSFLAEGTIIVGLLALLLDAGFAAAERSLKR
jgi:osmoprotectant transport system permease protein